jgi:YidC/Oxa1 family membrane protein insertase
MTNLLLAQILFPSGGNFIEKIVYNMLEWIMSWGWVNYGFAIIMFTIFVKLIMLPLDFTNRYFTKKNQIMMQKVAPEEKQLKETYAADPIALQRARQELYRKHGVGQGGFCLVMIVNLALTLIVFFSVFSGLRTVANYNIAEEVRSLQYQYQNSVTNGEDEVTIIHNLNNSYEERRVSFLWVKNIWRPDAFTSEIMTYKEYTMAIDKVALPIEEEDYNKIFGYIKQRNNGWGVFHWNGWMLLVVLAGGVTYLSTSLTMMMNKKNAPQKVGTKAEPIISYSLRDAKSQNNAPEIDPAQINTMMKVLMPIVMIVFAVTSTAAMSIYIITSSVVSTAFTLSLGYAVDEIIKRQKPKAVKGNDFDRNVINPHAKYFKNKDKGSK